MAYVGIIYIPITYLSIGIKFTYFAYAVALRIIKIVLDEKQN